MIAPGAPVEFTIVVRNVGLAPLDGGVLTDLLEPCFAPLGPDMMTCDPAVVQCSGNGCAGAAF